MSPIANITAESFVRCVLDSALPVLVAVCANGSPASQKLLALLEARSLETSGWVNFVQVNAAGSPELARHCGLPSAPGLALFHRGTVCYQFSGELSGWELENLLARAEILARTSTELAQPSVAQATL